MVKNNTVVFTCDFCGKEKRIRKSNYNSEGNHFCSKRCKDEWQKTGLKGENNPFFNKAHSKKSIEKISIAKKGRYTGKNAFNYNTHGVTCEYCGKKTFKIQYLINRSKHLFCSIECNGRWKSENLRGEKSATWNPNLTDEERKVKRKYPKYYEFITTVMKRDNFTCDICSKHNKYGNGLNAHHLNSYDWDKENRTNPENGITLCKECHTKFHKIYGFGKNTTAQYIKFKESI